MTDQTANIQQEIMTDARRKAERALKRARRDADKLHESARKECEDIRAKRLAEAENMAADKARAIVAGIPYEENKIKLLRQEQIFEEIFDQALKRLSKNGSEEINTTESIRQLLAEALEAMPDAGITVQVNPQNIAEAEKALVGLGRANDVDLDATEDVAAGIQAIAKHGKLRYDNTMQARFQREKARLRSELADMLNPKNE